MCPENKTGKYFFHFPSSKNSTQKQYLQRDCVTFHEKKNCLSFFTRKHFQKVPNPSVILFAYFLLQISSAFAIIFADCHCLSCVHVRANWYTAPFGVFLRGVRQRCVGLARKISVHCNTDSYVFSFFFIYIFILLLALSHMYMLF